MKKGLFILLTVAAMRVFNANLFAVGTNGIAVAATSSIVTDTNGIIADLNGIIVRVNEKLRQGKRTETDLASNLKEYDVLYAQHKNEKSEAVVEILLAKVNLYVQVLNDPEKAITVLKQIQNDFPGAQINGNTDDLIAALQKSAEAKKIQGSLVEGSPFPNFEEKDINGKPLSIASYKGKVALIDFWATWCPPCRAELPNILATYKKYHDAGFEVIGISLDEDKKQLEKFLKDQGMAWPQYNDGQFWNTKLVLKYGVTRLPSTWLLDGSGKIIGRDLRGDELTQAVAKALDGK